ncbi:hypothetical protein KIPB_016590, partial [Kipferlia bialata]
HPLPKGSHTPEVTTKGWVGLKVPLEVLGALQVLVGLPGELAGEANPSCVEQVPKPLLVYTGHHACSEVRYGHLVTASALHDLIWP